MLDISRKVTSCMGCCGLAAFSPVVWWCPDCLPAISLCQCCVGEAVDGFWSVELSGTCREHSIAQLTVEHRLCIQRLNSHPPLPFSSCLSSLWNSDTLPRHEEIYQGHTEMRAGSAGAQLSLAVPPSAGWQTLPSQAGTFFHAIVCLSWFFGS